MKVQTGDATDATQTKLRRALSRDSPNVAALARQSHCPVSGKLTIFRAH